MITTSWMIRDDGIRTGAEHMAIDFKELKFREQDPASPPLLRFFQWREPTITFGYLQNETQVIQWTSKINDQAPRIQRPTGGGTVYHQTTDLSLSLVFPRGEKLFRENPRDCYEDIHKIIEHAYRFAFQTKLNFHVNNGASCENKDRGLSVCFDEPVCHDLMKDGKKIVGGALRIKRNVLLYQGHILLSPGDHIQKLKEEISKAVAPDLIRGPVSLT